MTCPKCNDTITYVQFKKSGQRGYLCDLCKTLWFENEEVNENTGRSFDLYTQGDEYEYTIEETNGKAPDKESVAYKNCK